jgi:GH18 family chitinase
VRKATREVRRRNPELRVLIRVGGVRVPTEVAEALVKSPDRRTAFASSVARIIRDADLNGVEIDLRLDARGVSKQSKGGLVALAKVRPFTTFT